MISRAFSSVWLAALIALLASSSIACNKFASSKNSADVQTITLWHFWSEPAQQHAFESIIHRFEELHPGIHVECTALQWSEGKAKLQTAFSSGAAPDLIHIGLEWVHEFASAGVLDSLNDSLCLGMNPSLRENIRIGSALYAVPWVMNCRAMFIDNDLIAGRLLAAQATSGTLTLDQLQCAPMSPLESTIRNLIGVNAYEPHNVLKKTLPFMWSGGSHIFLSEPFSKSIDDKAARAFERYLKFCKGMEMASSRSLDESLKRHGLAAWVSGMWNLGDTNVDKNYTVTPRWPSIDSSADTSQSGWSILSADCYSMSRQSKHKAAAAELLAFLAQSQIELEYCAAIPDAGFPVHQSPVNAQHSLDTLFNRSPNAKAFYQQCLRSRPLPASAHFLDAERLFEEEVMQALYEKKTAAQALRDLQKALELLELSSANALH